MSKVLFVQITDDCRKTNVETCFDITFLIKNIDSRVGKDGNQRRAADEQNRVSELVYYIG